MLISFLYAVVVVVVDVVIYRDDENCEERIFSSDSYCRNAHNSKEWTFCFFEFLYVTTILIKNDNPLSL